MIEFTMQLNHPLTDEEWNTLTDAELEHSKKIEFTTPSGKKVLFQKLSHGEWTKIKIIDYYKAVATCSVCGKRIALERKYMAFCPSCGADMRKDDESVMETEIEEIQDEGC